MDSEPVAWSNGCNKSVPAALRYLAENPRPRGGESSFNTAHLYQLAREIEFMAEAPLYRHAQQPVVPEEMTKSLASIAKEYQTSPQNALFIVVGWNACRAAMLNHPSSIQLNTDAAPGTEIKHPSSNSPVIGIDLASGPDRTVEVRYAAPPGYVMVPKEPTAEMVIKMRYHVGGYDRNIKEGYKAMLAADDCSIPMISDRWIPVSERMPENKPGCYEYLVFETLNNRVNHDYWNVPDKGDDAFTPFWNYYGEHVTHWMPLPAAPQEVQGE
ncbi:DUF551 domain-containing protein [Klebsiella michiganensis]|uniref:DUF551 domain-containing protein n=1 Tax=Klebsiella michiganensis TaxID=1134687 RepID=UPI0039C4CB42